MQSCVKWVKKQTIFYPVHLISGCELLSEAGRERKTPLAASDSFTAYFLTFDPEVSRNQTIK